MILNRNPRIALLFIASIAVVGCTRDETRVVDKLPPPHMTELPPATQPVPQDDLEYDDFEAQFTLPAPQP
ncbi:MAG: hypothetical protein V3T70_01955 [Phycisphaerae bacterium]